VEIGYYIAELRGGKYDQALLVLPHDGNAHHGPIHKNYRDHFQDAGFEVDVIPNQGPGAAMLRIEAARRIFPRCWFNEKTTQAGLEALGFYQSVKTRRVTSASGRNTTGRHTRPMLSD
jgi:phage terminase large subunit